MALKLKKSETPGRESSVSLIPSPFSLLLGSIEDSALLGMGDLTNGGESGRIGFVTLDVSESTTSFIIVSSSRIARWVVSDVCK